MTPGVLLESGSLKQIIFRAPTGMYTCTKIFSNMAIHGDMAICGDMALCGRSV